MMTPRRRAVLCLDSADSLLIKASLRPVNPKKFAP